MEAAPFGSSTTSTQTDGAFRKVLDVMRGALNRLDPDEMRLTKHPQCSARRVPA